MFTLTYKQSGNSNSITVHKATDRNPSGKLFCSTHGHKLSYVRESEKIQFSTIRNVARVLGIFEDATTGEKLTDQKIEVSETIVGDIISGNCRMWEEYNPETGIVSYLPHRMTEPQYADFEFVSPNVFSRNLSGKSFWCFGASGLDNTLRFMYWATPIEITVLEDKTLDYKCERQKISGNAPTLNEALTSIAEAWDDDIKLRAVHHMEIGIQF